MKNQTMKITSTLLYPLTISLLIACNPSENDTPQPYDSGVIVGNAGNFTDNNGSISFVSRDTKLVTFNTFKKENSRELGGLVQQYTEIDGKGYIVVDNSSGADKIEVVNARTMQSIGKIQDADVINPRMMVAGPTGTGKAYLSYWGNLKADYTFNKGFVAVIDLGTMAIVKKIAVGFGPDAMKIVGTDLYVCNQGGDTKVSIINTQTDTQSQQLEVGGNAKAIETDINGSVWILANNKMLKINPQSKAIERSLKIGTHPEKEAGNLVINADKKTFYFTYSFYDANNNYELKGETYSFGIDDTSIAANKPLINRVFSGLGYDAAQNRLYAGFTPSYKQAGYVFRYETSGKIIDSVKVEIAPSSFYFK